jgi:ribosome-binding protein aMBF1 (putative translation factor)
MDEWHQYVGTDTTAGDRDRSSPARGLPGEERTMMSGSRSGPERTLEDDIAQRGARDPEFRQALDALRPELEFRMALIRARLAVRLTQAELAERVGTKQSSIARLETGSARPSFDMLQRLSAALNVSFEIMPSHGVTVHFHQPAT